MKAVGEKREHPKLNCVLYLLTRRVTTSASALRDQGRTIRGSHVNSEHRKRATEVTGSHGWLCKKGMPQMAFPTIKRRLIRVVHAFGMP